MDPKDTDKNKEGTIDGNKNGERTTHSVQTPKRTRESIAILRFKNKTLRIDKDRIVFGAIESADVKLSGEDISPIHAVLEFSEEPVAGAPIATLFDLASQTGVFINGEKRVTASIFQNSSIQIGNTLIDLSFEGRSTVAPKLQFDEILGQKLFISKEEDLKLYLYEPNAKVQTIFDYRPSENKRAIEVVMSLGAKVFAFEHFVGQKKITLGDGIKEDFPAPSTFNEKNYVFIEPQGEQVVLQIHPKMKGVIQQNGELRKVEDIISSGGGGGSRFTLGQKDFAKIQIEQLDFYISFTAAPPHLKTKNQFGRDLLLWKFILFGLLLGTALIVGLLNVKISPSIEAEKLPERVATILYQPEKFPPIVKKVPQQKTEKTEETKPEPKEVAPKVTKVDLEKNKVKPAEKIPDRMKVGAQTDKKPTQGSKTAASKQKKQQGQSEAQEGAGARAKGTEGRRGSKSSSNRSAESQNSATRPSPEAGKGKGGGASQVAGEGNIDALKGATSEIQNLLSGTTQKLGKGGGEKFEGFGGFTTAGGGGLALSGKGQGGGGSADTLGGGLSDKGIGGGKVGTGLGAAGKGSGIVGGKTRIAIRSGGAEEGVVMGAIDAGAIEAALLAHKDEFRLCYEKEINAQNPNLAGRVSTLFVIGSSGRVTSAGVSSSTLGSRTAELCVLAVIKRIQFPIPEGGGVVQVRYPFKFSPTGR